MPAALKAPFPYFGGKSAVADLVWSRLGDPDNYVEPFAGTIATLLRRPKPGKIETVNDRNHFVANFWRSVQNDPDGVTEHADWPISEADLHARHGWLMRSELSAEFRQRFASDPEFYDVRFAGWWVWGQCCWIGGGWCDGETPSDQPRKPMTSASQLGRGVNNVGKTVAVGKRQIPDLRGDSGAFGLGVNRSSGFNRDRENMLTADQDGHSKRPILDGGSRGVASLGRPQLGDAFDIGRGVNSNKHAGTCAERREWLRDWISRLADRLRLVRVCYGHWSRICDSRTTMVRLGTTGAFVDPPYAKNIERVQALIRGDEVAAKAAATNRANELYAGDKTQDIDRLVAEVNQWCQSWGAHDQVRIALCGYEGEHDNLVSDHGWTVMAWKAQGGYGNRNADNSNKERERIWFSPACLDPDAEGWLF